VKLEIEAFSYLATSHLTMGTPYDDFVQRVNIENHNLQTKVHDLENTLKSFRAETEMKITMLERIFALKNGKQKAAVPLRGGVEKKF